MLKKLALGTAVVCALPFLDPSFRKGFKYGWNTQYDMWAEQGIYPMRPFNRKFKNV
jgi:hypothetical protein